MYSPAEHSRDTIRAVIRFQAQRLLTGCIPHTHHEDEARVDDSFDKAEEEAVNGDASEVVACWCGHEQAAPYCACRSEEFRYSRGSLKFTYRRAAEELSYRQLLKSQAGWPLGNEVAKVEYGTYYDVSNCSHCIEAQRPY